MVLCGNNVLGLKRFILNESTNNIIFREGLPRFYIARDK
jgi:hypothetical protein